MNSRVVELSGHNNVHELDHAQENGWRVVLTPEQVRWVLKEYARLVEAKNQAVRELWAQKEKANGTEVREEGMGDGKPVP